MTTGLLNAIHSSAILLLVLPLLFGVARRQRQGRPLPPGWRGRTCQGRAWRRTFPAAPKLELRDFLQCVVDAFGFAPHTRLQFSPDDVLMDIYRQFYPQHWMPDNLELEILERDLLERHPGAQASMARLAQTRFTLGELFAAVHSEISHRRPDAPASVA